MNEHNNRNSLTLIIIGILAFMLILMIPFGASLFIPEGPYLDIQELAIDDPLEQLEGDSIESFLARDRIISENLTIDSEFADLNNHTLDEIFSTPLDLQDLNLVTNGDFSDGNTGYILTNATITNNELLYNSTTTGYAQKLSPELKQNTTYYISFNVNLISRISGVYGIRIMYPVIYELTTIQLGQQYISDLHTPNQNINGFIIGGISNGNGHAIFDNINIIDVTSLIIAQQYSPLYSTTFDLMSDSEIKTQLDYWVTNPHLYLDYETLGIDHLSQTDLEYYYEMYQALTPLDLQDLNLVTNGNFTEGLFFPTGWTTLANHWKNITRSNNGINATANTQAPVFFQNIVNDNSYANKKIYYNFKMKIDTIGQGYAYLQDGITITKFEPTSTELTQYQGIYQLSSVSTLFRIGQSNSNSSNWTNQFLGEVYLSDVSTLITAQQYSPLYGSTFDLMTDEQIKTQLDDWIVNPHLYRYFPTIPTGVASLSSGIKYYVNLSGHFFNLSDFQTSQQYSPLNSDTFDNLDDTELENQMDDWLDDDYDFPLIDFAISEEEFAWIETLAQEFTDRDGGLPNQILLDIYTWDDLIYDIPTLKNKLQYSPLYYKTFNDLTDNEILAQMNDWVYYEKLPN